MITLYLILCSTTRSDSCIFCLRSNLGSKKGPQLGSSESMARVEDKLVSENLTNIWASFASLGWAGANNGTSVKWPYPTSFCFYLISTTARQLRFTNQSEMNSSRTVGSNSLNLKMCSRYPLLNTRYAEGLIQSQGQGPMPIQTQVTLTSSNCIQRKYNSFWLLGVAHGGAERTSVVL